MGIHPLSRAAVFLDRDGVINPNVFNPATGQWESPHRVEDFRLNAGVIAALRRLEAAGYLLFVVSNQPDYAKGKASLEAVLAIAERCRSELEGGGIRLAQAYYCLHHPDGHVPGYSGPCACRKPSPHFLLRARDDYGLDMGRSWMVGDRDTDVECGHAAGVRTIQIAPDHPTDRAGAACPSHSATDLPEATAIILGTSGDGETLTPR